MQYLPDYCNYPPSCLPRFISGCKMANAQAMGYLSIGVGAYPTQGDLVNGTMPVAPTDPLCLFYDGRSMTFVVSQIAASARFPHARLLFSKICEHKKL